MGRATWAVVLWVVWVWLGPLALAQTDPFTFSGELGVEAVFVPTPPLFSTAAFDLDLSVALLETRFSSHTRFDLQNLVRQVFVLRITLGELVVQNELKFGSAAAFERDKLEARLNFPSVDVGGTLLLQDTQPTQSPSIHLGWVFQIDWRVFKGVSLFGDTGFGVAQISEDLDNDGAVDFNVQNTFMFDEAALGARLNFPPLSLETKAVFTALGLSKQVFTATLNFRQHRLTLSSALTLDAGLLLKRVVLEARHDTTPVSWHSTTVIAGNRPFSLTLQTFQLWVRVVDGVRVKAAAVFAQAGVVEARLGGQFTF